MTRLSGFAKPFRQSPGEAYDRGVRRPVFWVDVAVKVALIGLLLLPVARPDLP